MYKLRTPTSLKSETKSAFKKSQTFKKKYQPPNQDELLNAMEYSGIITKDQKKEYMREIRQKDSKPRKLDFQSLAQLQRKADEEEEDEEAGPAGVQSIGGPRQRSLSSSAMPPTSPNPDFISGDEMVLSDIESESIPESDLGEQMETLSLGSASSGGGKKSRKKSRKKSKKKSKKKQRKSKKKKAGKNTRKRKAGMDRKGEVKSVLKKVLPELPAEKIASKTVSMEEEEEEERRKAYEREQAEYEEDMAEYRRAKGREYLRDNRAGHS